MEDKNVATEETNEEVVDNEETKETPEHKEPVYSQSDLDREISLRFEKWEKRQQKEIEEAQKLASMDAQEKAQYELDKREEELNKLERSIIMQQNTNQCMTMLSDRGIDVGLAEFVVAEDAETMKANIDNIDKIFKAAVESEVNKRLQGTTPKRDVTDNAAITKDQFKNMSVSERQKLYETDKELYQQLR